MFKKTHVVFVLDQSGSMGHLGTKAKNLYNNLLSTIRERSCQECIDTTVGLVTFSHYARTEYCRVNVDRVNDLERYPTSGGTALRDGTLAGIECAAGIGYEDAAYLVIVVTDGEDNALMQKLSPRQLGDKIVTLQNRGNWTFAFNVPPGQKHRLVGLLGVPEGNVTEWEQTDKGIYETQVHTQAAVGTYLTSRAAGQTQVTNFYKVTTDLSKVTDEDLNKLTHLKHIKMLEVTKEAEVRPFVEEKLKKPFVIGAAYYQLTKPEKVQPSKGVLIVEKGRKLVFGGDEARKLIGLPTDGKSYAKVKPGNHGNFDIFIQSRTVNRKLVRGTKLLIDTLKQTSDNPTWDYTLGGTR